MSFSAERWACDTSVAVPSLDRSHEAHAVCRRALIERRPVLSGHAAFETYSVLTRLPPPLRLTSADAADVLAAAFSEPCWLDTAQSEALWATLGELNLAGGSVYDALVGSAAKAAGRVLLTRDRRAERVYRRIGVAYEFVE